MKLLEGMSPKEAYLTRENELLKHKLHYWERRYENETIMPTFEDAKIHTIIEKDVTAFRVAIARHEFDPMQQRHHLYAIVEGPEAPFQISYYLTEPRLRSVDEVTRVAQDIMNQVTNKLISSLEKYIEN